MFASIPSQVAPTSAVGAPATASALPGRSKLEARFSVMLEAADVEAVIQDEFGTMGLTKLALSTSLGKDSDRLRAFLAKPPLELDEDKRYPDDSISGQIGIRAESGKDHRACRE